jgi:DNA-binding SARP family transcriptional activator
MPTLQIHMLGAFHVLYDGKPVTTLRSARLQSLLGYLVLNRAAPLPRRDLAFLLWPDSTESQSHTNLHKLLHGLRTALPDVDTFVLIDRQNVQWKNDAPFTLDAAEFEQAASRASTIAKLQATV